MAVWVLVTGVCGYIRGALSHYYSGERTSRASQFSTFSRTGSREIFDAAVRNVFDFQRVDTRKSEIAGEDDPSVLKIAERVREVAAEEAGIDVDVELVENPRAGEETLVEDFAVDTTRAHEELRWEATHGVEESVRELIRRRA